MSFVQNLVLSQEQLMLQTSAKEFFDSNLSIEQFRAQRDEHSIVLSDAQTWQQMVELGWSAILVPEALDGLEFGVTGMGVITIEAGRNLVASHLLSSASFSVSALLSCQPSDARDTLLRAIASGKQVPCFAQCTGGIRGSHQSGYSGKIAIVHEAMSADSLLLLCEIENEPRLLQIDLNSQGVKRQPMHLIDFRDYAAIELDQVTVINSFECGSDIAGPQELGALLTACELFGISSETFERTIQYLCEREQFGQKIGSFQALQHRMAQAYMQLQLFKSVLYDALSGMEANRDDALIAISHAKVLANDVSQLICTEAIQLHGGMGITDELDIGLFYKRARVLRTRFGSSSFHKQRFADLTGL